MRANTRGYLRENGVLFLLLSTEAALGDSQLRLPTGIQSVFGVNKTLLRQWCYSRQQLLLLLTVFIYEPVLVHVRRDAITSLSV